MFAKRWIYLARRFSLNKKNPWLQSAASPACAHPFDEKAKRENERVYFRRAACKVAGREQTEGNIMISLDSSPKRTPHRAWICNRLSTLVRREGCLRPAKGLWRRRLQLLIASFIIHAVLELPPGARVPATMKAALSAPGACLSIVDPRCIEPGNSLVLVTSSFPVLATWMTNNFCQGEEGISPHCCGSYYSCDQKNKLCVKRYKTNLKIARNAK